MGKLYWTKERCFSAAKQCKTRNEYKKKFMTAYMKSLKMKWMDDYIWFLPPIHKIHKEKIDLIYVYEFPNKVVYIGRTIKIDVRHWEHKNRKDKDTVAKYIDKNKFYNFI